MNATSVRLFILALYFLSKAAEAQICQVTDLGSFGTPGDINNATQIAGWNSQAIIIQNGQFTNIHNEIMGDWSRGFGINNSGHVVGPSRLGAYIYDGAMMLPLGDEIVRAFSINDSDQVAALHFYNNPDPRGEDVYTVILWENGISFPISPVPEFIAYYDTTDGLGINNAGQVVGPFGLYDKTNGLQDIKPVNMSILNAKSINENGIIVGAADFTYGGGGGDLHAFIRTNGSIIDLGTFGGAHSCANDINDNNEVVGYATTTGENGRAFYWTDSSGIVDLNILIDSNSGWVLNNAKAINNSGQIVGTGEFNGEGRGFLLSPVPKPATTSLIFCAMSVNSMPPSMSISNGAIITPVYIQRCSDLVNTNWINVTNLLTGFTNWTDTTAPGAWTSIYYRLVQ